MTSRGHDDCSSPGNSSTPRPTRGMTTNSRIHWTILLALLAGCGGDSEGSSVEPEAVALTGDWDIRIPAEELERGRLDASWQRVVQLDSAGITPGTVDNPEK